jgi:hypothetical protein
MWPPLTFVFNTMPDTWVSIGSLDHPEDWPLSKQGTWGQITHEWRTEGFHGTTSSMASLNE